MLCSTLLAQTYTWEDCLSLARENNLALKIAREKVEAKKISLNSLYSGLYPQLGGSLSASTGSSASGDDDLFAATPRNSESARLSVQQQIFDAQTSPKIAQGKSALAAEQLNYTIAEINLRLQLRQEFCTLLQTQQSLDLAKTVSDRRRQQYELVELRYTGGLEHRGSLLTAKANLTKAEQSEKQLQRRLDRNKLQLVQTLGLDTQDLQITENLQNGSGLAPHQSPNIDALLESSPVLQAVAARLDSAKYDSAIAKNAWLPSIYANASLGKNWAQSDNVDSEDSSWSLGGSLSFDLFDGGKKTNAYNNAILQEKIQALDFDANKQKVKLTLIEAWDKLADADDSILAAQEQLKASTERSTIAAEQYANGLISFDNWIIIEDALISAQQQELSTRIDALLQEAGWLNAKGETL
ncbi:outer membrane protein TolC [Candidatus Termititenax dinenymphae]|uniref:Outer membrane protein TolC n=1 Tax=Candidatus Termititenax dinenymphae TaxID=2218523 RepID=A0A388TKZ8_9BACT|nr:outer membrane protein TolC [Candidatus Termititenax dinenymphae]